MVSLRTFVLSAVVPTFVVLASCAEPRVPQHAVKVEQICQTSCKRQSDCRADVDTNACEASCAGGSKWRNFWRQDYVDASVQCLKSASCEVVGDVGARAKSCFVGARLTPSAAAVRFCEALVVKDATCRREEPRALSKEHCLERYGMVDDDTLGQMIACQQERACGSPNGIGRRDDCMRDIVDDSGERADDF